MLWVPKALPSPFAYFILRQRMIFKLVLKILILELASCDKNDGRKEHDGVLEKFLTKFRECEDG